LGEGKEPDWRPAHLGELITKKSPIGKGLGKPLLSGGKLEMAKADLKTQGVSLTEGKCGRGSTILRGEFEPFLWGGENLRVCFWRGSSLRLQEKEGCWYRKRNVS